MKSNGNPGHEKDRTELSELGEFGLISHLTDKIRLKHPGSVKGVGDDAAVIDSRGMLTVVATDMLVEGVHFDIRYTPLKHLGYKSVVVNISDIYAMNAQPLQITVSVAISSKYSLEAVDELYQGIYLACEKYGVDLVGGDTTSSLSGLVISITALGEAAKEDLVYRSGAKKNDLLCVSGDLGAAYAGLLLLEREKTVFLEDTQMQPKLDGYGYVIGRQLKPEARRDVILRLKELKIKPTAMIDISDGLSSEALHLCKNSKTGCCIYEDKIPVAPETEEVAKEFSIDPAVFALNGGEDYELLFTLALSEYEKIKDEQWLRVIGHITGIDEGEQLVMRGGSMQRLKAQGWNALKG